jgi:cytochrome c-type biogenesis protein
MTPDVSILAALFAGLISFLSPCVLPLVPPYLVYLAGASMERLADAEPPALVKRDVLIAAVLFVAGFSTVFVALGAGASVIGGLLRLYSYELSLVAGVAIIVMGLHFLGLTPISLLHRQARMEMPRPVGLWGAYVMGLAFAFGWTPCIGPILAAILAVAGSETSVWRGAALLAVYSAGLGIPFLITALAFSRATTAFAAIKRHYSLIIGTGGAILIAMGILILTGSFTDLNIQAQKWTTDLGLNP